ncbi:hypothetical protein ACFYZB_04750 [Streptomyces sp. NPDC001852]|uniref:hypothetical protein n=1 Tax=Streptomyces sp. NPDC001852 TaxID=3364619 RepID=UPI00368BF265
MSTGNSAPRGGTSARTAVQARLAITENPAKTTAAGPSGPVRTVAIAGATEFDDRP